MHNTHPTYTRHGGQQLNGAPWSNSSLYTNGTSHPNPHPNSGSVGTACSSPDGGGDYPMTEGQQQHFYSSLRDALASDSTPANNLNTATGSAGYSSLGLHTYPPLSGGSPVHRQSGTSYNGLNNIYSSPSRSAREWADNLLVMDDAEPFPDYINSTDTGDYYRRAAVSVKHEPEDADMGRMDAQQRARNHFVMEPHPTSAYVHHAHTLSSGSGSTGSYPHPPHSPHAGFASPLSPLSPGARAAHPASSGTGTGTGTGAAAAAASASGAATDLFHSDSKVLHSTSPFSAFSSAGGVAGVSSPMPDMLFDVGANGDSDPQASLLASPPVEPILPHAMTAPLRAVNASKEMRRMMGVFRLNPFTMMNGAPVKSAWDGSGAGPLESEPVQLEFRVYFEGMLIEDEEEEDDGGGGAGGGRLSEGVGYGENEDMYEVAAPGASQAYLGSRRGFSHAQRTSVPIPSPPAFNAFGLRTAGPGPSSMGASTTIARSIFDRDLERQREMRGGNNLNSNGGGGPFASSASSSVTHHANQHHHSAINANAMNAHSALLRSRSTASRSVSDGLSDSSTAVCAIPGPTLGVSGVDSVDYLASVDLDSSRPHSQGSFGSPHSSAYPTTSSAYIAGSSTQAALRAQSHSQSLFRGEGSSAAPGGGGGGGGNANMFTTTPAALAAEMHMSARARQLYGAGRTRHGSLSSNRSEMSGSASPPVMHGAAEYQHQAAAHRSPNLLPHHQQQQRPSRHAVPPPYQQVDAAVALDLDALATPTASVGQQSFIGPGHGGGEHYARDENNATTYGLSSASFGSPFDGSSHGHISPVEHSAVLSRRWPDTSSMQRVYS